MARTDTCAGHTNRSSMVKSIATTLVCLTLLGSTASAQTIYVAVTTRPPADPTFLTPEERGLRDSEKDLKELIDRYSFRLADGKHPADVTLEVLARFLDPQDDNNNAVRVKLTAGTYEATIIGRDNGQWYWAASDVCKQLAKWATRAKRQELVGGRPQQAEKK
jgi:hypothetical protein